MGEIVKFVWFWAISLCNYVQIRKSQLKPTQFLCKFFHTPKIIIFPNELIPGYFITFAVRRNKNKLIFLSFSCFFHAFAFWQHPNSLNFLTNPLWDHFLLPTGACSNCKIIEKYSKTTFCHFIFISAHSKCYEKVIFHMDSKNIDFECVKKNTQKSARF